MKLMCPICAANDTNPQQQGQLYTADCPRCGRFSISDSAVAELDATPLTPRQAANASGWVRENEGARILSSDLADLRNIGTPTVGERAAKLLREISRQWPAVGEEFEFSFSLPLKQRWLAASWSASDEEVEYLLLTYLHDELEAVSGNSPGPGRGSFLLEGRITPRGHELLEKLRTGNSESQIGFCAMWFDDDIRLLWTEAIESAIRAAGYEPKRIDQHEHTNRIDDEIVAMIRRSRFVVADFTGQRGGVYFEAGFALGLGLRVIWLCREDELPKLHFDTRQYNFLAWKPGEFEDLAKRLRNRIEATLGQGPKH